MRQKKISAEGRSFGNAFRGMGTLLKSQPHARFHLLATVAVIALGVFCRISRGEWLAIVLAVGLVWLAEGLNTALELLANALDLGHHPLIKKAKDVAAAAVLLSALAALAIGLIVFLPRIF